MVLLVLPIGQTSIVDGGSSACLTSNLQVAKRLLRKSALTASARKETEKLFAAWPRRRLAAGASDAKAVKRPMDSECNLRGNVIRIAYTGRIVSQHLRRTGQALADIVRTQHSVGVAADRQRGVSWALVCSNHIGTPRRAIAGMIRIFILRPPTPFCALSSKNVSIPNSATQDSFPTLLSTTAVYSHSPAVADPGRRCATDCDLRPSCRRRPSAENSAANSPVLSIGEDGRS